MIYSERKILIQSLIGRTILLTISIYIKPFLRPILVLALINYKYIDLFLLVDRISQLYYYQI